MLIKHLKKTSGKIIASTNPVPNKNPSQPARLILQNPTRQRSNKSQHSTSLTGNTELMHSKFSQQSMRSMKKACYAEKQLFFRNSSRALRWRFKLYLATVARTPRAYVPTFRSRIASKRSHYPVNARGLDVQAYKHQKSCQRVWNLQRRHQSSQYRRLHAWGGTCAALSAWERYHLVFRRSRRTSTGKRRQQRRFLRRAKAAKRPSAHRISHPRKSGVIRRLYRKFTARLAHQPNRLMVPQRHFLRFKMLEQRLPASLQPRHYNSQKLSALLRHHDEDNNEEYEEGDRLLPLKSKQVSTGGLQSKFRNFRRRTQRQIDAAREAKTSARMSSLYAEYLLKAAVVWYPKTVRSSKRRELSKKRSVWELKVVPPKRKEFREPKLAASKLWQFMQSPDDTVAWFTGSNQYRKYQAALTFLQRRRRRFAMISYVRMLWATAKKKPRNRKQAVSVYRHQVRTARRTVPRLLRLQPRDLTALRNMFTRNTIALTAHYYEQRRLRLWGKRRRRARMRHHISRRIFRRRWPFMRYLLRRRAKKQRRVNKRREMLHRKAKYVWQNRRATQKKLSPRAELVLRIRQKALKCRIVRIMKRLPGLGRTVTNTYKQKTFKHRPARRARRKVRVFRRTRRPQHLQRTQTRYHRPDKTFPRHKAVKWKAHRISTVSARRSTLFRTRLAAVYVSVLAVPRKL